MKNIQILLFLIVTSFLLVSCWWDNTKKIEVKQETKKQEVKKQENINKIEEKNVILEKFNKDIKKISFNELNNSLYSNGGWNNLKEKIKILSASWETINNKMKATFLQSFIWDYKNALEKRKELCKNNSNLDFCKKIDLSLISYRPTDNDWNILDNVKISVDWKYIWDLKWKNTLQVENKFIHRIRVSKQWYLDFYKKNFIDSNWNEKESLNPQLLKADKKVIIDTNKDTKVDTDNFSYNIQSNSFITKNWKKYSWKVNLYVFDITEDDWDLNVLNLDIFDKNGDYVWNSMVTFGMPLLKAYDDKWNELVIWKKIIGKWIIQNLEKAPWIDLNNVPKNKWLSKNELDKYKIPPFWYLDQKNWVWLESEMKILDSNWNYEFRLK